MVKRKCKFCNTEFITYPCYIKIGGGKYCSRKCANVKSAKDGFVPKAAFKKGSNGYWKGKKRLSMSGKNHPRWKNGRAKHSDGYVCIRKHNHPFVNKRGYVMEHRLIIEKQIGRYLLLKEICHHLNEIKDDNRPQNLMAFINENIHQRFHKNPNNVKPSEIIFDGRKLKT